MGIYEKLAGAFFLLRPLEVLEVDVGHSEVRIAAAVLQERCDDGVPVCVRGDSLLVQQVETVALVALVDDLSPSGHRESPEVLRLLFSGTLCRYLVF